MARIRSIHPGFFTDEAFVQVSAHARLLLLGLGVEADDKGTFPWKPVTLKMRLFPLDIVDMQELLAELVKADAIRRYKMDGKEYGAIRNFRIHQRPKKPNDVNPMPEEFGTYVGLTDTSSVPVGNQSGKTSADGGEDGGEGSISDTKVSSPGELRPETVVEAWNEMAGRLNLAQVRSISAKRRAQLKTRIRDHPLSHWIDALNAIERSQFLLGENNRGWRADFDFLLQPSSFQKLIEGSYDRK